MEYTPSVMIYTVNGKYAMHIRNITCMNRQIKKLHKERL